MTSSYAAFSLYTMPSLHDPMFLLILNGNPTAEQIQAARALLITQSATSQESEQLIAMTSSELADHLTVRLTSAGFDATVTRLVGLGGILP